MDRLKKPGYRFLAELVMLPSCVAMMATAIAAIAG